MDWTMTDSDCSFGNGTCFAMVKGHLLWSVVMSVVCMFRKTKRLNRLVTTTAVKSIESSWRISRGIVGGFEFVELVANVLFGAALCLDAKM